MYTDFIYYNIMRDQENETLIKNLDKQEKVAQKHNMKISQRVIHDFKNIHKTKQKDKTFEPITEEIFNEYM